MICIIVQCDSARDIESFGISILFMENLNPYSLRSLPLQCSEADLVRIRVNNLSCCALRKFSFYSLL